jgi:hypothetical protein
MRFPTIFKRILPATAGTKTLGTDTVPGAGVPPDSSADNLLVAKNNNINGWPVHRVAVTYFTDAGAPIDLTAKMYFYEEASARWYLIGQGTLKNGQVTFFDIISLADPPQTQKNLAAGNSGSISQILIVDAGAAPNGNYVFTMGPDLTTFP